MEEIFIQEFVDAWNALEKAKDKYPTSPYPYLTGLFMASISNRLGVKRVQKIVDEKTAEMQKELSELMANVS